MSTFIDVIILEIFYSESDFELLQLTLLLA